MTNSAEAQFKIPDRVGNLAIFDSTYCSDIEHYISAWRVSRIVPAGIKLALVPTSLSAAEWSGTGTWTNTSGKTQHFGLASHKSGAADFILCDPELAGTAPEKLWLSSGMRCVALTTASRRSAIANAHLKSNTMTLKVWRRCPQADGMQAWGEQKPRAALTVHLSSAEGEPAGD